MLEPIELPQWEFTPGKASNAWLSGGGSEPTETVTLPHTWNALDTFQPGVRYRRGWGSYRTMVDLPEASSRCLVVGPMPGGGDVWFNGERQTTEGPSLNLGDKSFTMQGAYEFDFNWLESLWPKNLKAGQNWIAFRLHNKYRRHMLPGIDEPDFVIHGGLSGPVSLEDVSRSHAWPHRPSLSFRVDKTSSDLALWHVDDPQLHDLELPASDGASHTIRIGVRTAEFRPNEGFFLNGERLELRGVNRHDFIPGLGRGLSREMQRDDARRIKEMGFNLVRLSHYPQAPDFLDACDEFGLLVYAEVATWKRVRGGRWLKNAKRQLEDLVDRNLHRPSFILMGLANEAQNRKVFEEMLEGLESVPIATIYAENHLYRATRKNTAAMTDVYGVNYELDILEDIRAASKNQVLLVSEMSNNPDARRGNFAEELRQCEILLGDWTKLAGKNYVAGWCVWCWADYATMRKNRYLRWSGIVDCWRSEKMAADLVRARNFDSSTRSVLALHADWREGGATTREVVVISNDWPVWLGEKELARPENGLMTRAQISSDIAVATSLTASFTCPWHGAHDRFEVTRDGPWALVCSVDEQGRRVFDQEETIVVKGDVVPWNPRNEVLFAKGEARCPLLSDISGEMWKIEISTKNPDLPKEFYLEKRQ